STNLIAVLQKKQERAAAEPRVPHELGREMHTASLVLWLLQKSHSGKQNVSAPAGAPALCALAFLARRPVSRADVRLPSLHSGQKSRQQSVLARFPGALAIPFERKAR